MNLSRRLSLPAHGAIEFVAGLTLMLAPAALSVGAVGLVVSATLGAILTGTALTLTAQEGSGVSPHSHFDGVFVLVVAIAALVLAATGEVAAAILLVAIVLVQASLTFTTRYVSAE